MGRLFKSDEVKKVEGWLESHYERHPEGISGISLTDGGAVEIRLEDPLDVDLLDSIARNNDFQTEVVHDTDGTRVLNTYSVVKDEGEIVTKSLYSVFREEMEVSLGSDPLSEESPNLRLAFVTAYLREKYGR